MAATILKTQDEYNIYEVLKKNSHAPTAVNVSLWSDQFLSAFPVAFLGYAISLSLAKTFGMKHNYDIIPMQEAFALGQGDKTEIFKSTLRSPKHIPYSHFCEYPGPD